MVLTSSKAALASSTTELGQERGRALSGLQSAIREQSRKLEEEVTNWRTRVRGQREADILTFHLKYKRNKLGIWHGGVANLQKGSRTGAEVLAGETQIL